MIKQPIMAHQFKVITSRVLSSIPENVMAVKFDQLNNIISMTIRATVDVDDFNAIDVYAHSPFLRVHVMDAYTKPLFAIQANVKLIKNELTLDYADSSFAIHYLEWEYTSLTGQPV